MFNRLVRTMATCGSPAIGLMMTPTATIGYPAFGWRRLILIITGRRHIGVTQGAFMGSTEVIGARMWVTMEASIMVTGMADMVLPAADGQGEHSVITRRW